MHGSRRLVLVLATAAACTPVDYHECDKMDQVSLTMRGKNWYDIGDNILHVRVYETKDGWVEQSEQIELDPSGKLEHVFECGLDDGATYAAAWYVNVNDDFGCQRADRVWEEDLGTATDDLLLEIAPDDPEDNGACEHF